MVDKFGDLALITAICCVYYFVNLKLSNLGLQMFIDG